MLLISIRFFVASMALISLLSLASTVFSELPAILQNNAIVQDIYSGKVAIFMLLPALIFAGIMGILFSLYLKRKGKNLD